MGNVEDVLSGREPWPGKGQEFRLIRPDWSERPRPENRDQLAPAERYHRDPLFNQLVDMMEHMIESANMTPTEVREAALLASIHYETRHVRPIVTVGGAPGSLSQVWFQCMDCENGWLGPPLCEVKDTDLKCPRCGGKRR